MMGCSVRGGPIAGDRLVLGELRLVLVVNPGRANPFCDTYLHVPMRPV
jgi:hypothetical protein